MENSTLNPVLPPTSPISDCCVCLQTCLHPVELPCKHIFCFLCIKGAAYHNHGQCPLCRQPLPQNYLAQPKLIIKEHLNKNDMAEAEESDEFNWYYEGKNGWWKYDERTNMEIEKRFQNNEKVFEILIAGLIYIINLEAMVQCQRANPARCRQIKRDKVIEDIKGTAGLSKKRLQYMKGSSKNVGAAKTCDTKKPVVSNDDKLDLLNSIDVDSNKIGSIKNYQSQPQSDSCNKKQNALKLDFSSNNLSRSQYYNNLLQDSDEEDNYEDTDSDDRDFNLSFDHSNKADLPLFLREVVGSSVDSEIQSPNVITSQPFKLNTAKKDINKIPNNAASYNLNKKTNYDIANKTNILNICRPKNPSIVNNVISNSKDSNVPSTSHIVKTSKLSTNIQMKNSVPIEKINRKIENLEGNKTTKLSLTKYENLNKYNKFPITEANEISVNKGENIILNEEEDNSNDYDEDYNLRMNYLKINPNL